MREQQEELKVEGKALESDRGKLEAFAKEIQKRSEEIDELCKVFSNNTMWYSKDE